MRLYRKKLIVFFWCFIILGIVLGFSPLSAVAADIFGKVTYNGVGLGDGQVDITPNNDLYTALYTTTALSSGDYLFSNVSLTDGEQYYVKAYRPLGETSYIWWVGYSFTFDGVDKIVDIQLAKIIQLDSPPNGTTIDSLTPTLEWTFDEGVTSYTLQVNKTDNWFPSVLWLTGLPAVPSYTIPANTLLNGVNYTWQVDAYNAGWWVGTTYMQFNFNTPSACTDTDGDGICDDVDNCPLDVNPGQEDADADGIGNACDPCPVDALNDFDGDGICGDVDNCPFDVNPLQEDSDGDGDGDVCDPAAMGTEPQQPTGDVVISASTGAVFVDVTVTLKPLDLDGDGDLDDTYYVKPDPYNVVPKLFPCGGENEIAADQVLCGPPCSLPNDLVLVTAAGGPQDFTTTIELTQWFTRLAPGCYNVKAEYVNFCRDLDFGIPEACTEENPCIRGIWQGKKDLGDVKGLVLEASQTVDQCPTLPGSAGGTGCPYADKNIVMLHTVSLGKCLWKLNWEKEPLAGVSVRVFDRKNPAFLAVAGRSNPNSSLYGVIFEANQGRVGACTTDANGVCYAGEGLKGYYLVIIRFTDPETGSTVYVGRPKDPCDYDSSGIDVKHFQIMKVYKDGLFKEYRGGRLTVVEGSILELIEPESAVWDGNSSIYPFIFTSDSNWSVDVCAKVPAGYRIVGVYDANGNLTQSSECVQAFVNGETKTMAFEVLETGSPEPSLNATLSLKSPKGKKVKKEVRASDVRKKTFKKWLSQAKAKIKR